jgi:hypothetical protein
MQWGMTHNFNYYFTSIPSATLLYFKETILFHVVAESTLGAHAIRETLYAMHEINNTK